MAPPSPVPPVPASATTSATPNVAAADAGTGVLDVPAAAAAAATEPDTRRRPGLSPSRANDFAQCPLLFRYRVVDRLPEPPSEAAARGTLVHAVLEKLYDAPAGERTLDLARSMLPTQWDALQEAHPDYSTLFTQSADVNPWLGTAGALLGTYFTLEDPNRLEPAARELFVESQLDGGPLLRGIVDRLDVAPDGALRVVDYKTGKSPRAGYEGSALFQMRFYGLVLWRTRGLIPRMLQLVYLGDGQVLRHEPAESELRTVEQRVRSTWDQILQSAVDGRWEPRTSALCRWCAHQVRCPAFGGETPPIPPGAVERALGVVPTAG